MSLKKPKNEDAVILEELQTEFYTSFKENPQLFIETESVENQQLYLLNPKNLIVLFVYEKFKLKSWIDLNVVYRKANNNNTLLSYESYERVDSSSTRKLIQFQITKDPSNNIIEMKANNTSTSTDIEYIELSTERPSVSIRGKMVISGLSSILRFLLKYCYIREKNDAKTNVNTNDCRRLRSEMKKLLGFRGGCLQSVSSIWTKFCEYNMAERMIFKLNEIIKDWSSQLSNSEWNLEIPQDLLRFEHHLAQPVKIFNSGKYSNQAKMLANASRSGSVSTQLNHDFAEGPDITLSDIVLFPSVHLAIDILGKDIFDLHLFRVSTWYHRVREYFDFKDEPLRLRMLLTPAILNLRSEKTINVNVPQVPEESLYKTDRSRYNPKLREYTKQEEIDDAVRSLHRCGFNPLSTEVDLMRFERDLVDWNLVPLIIHPQEGGKLPAKRIKKKNDQLRNLAQMVKFVLDQKIALKNGQEENKESQHAGCTIVDFCSGGGHLGILLAWLFPDAQIILVENREESLRRALERIDKLKLGNISVFQSNLNNFNGLFDVGVALHACGTATDLVLEKCRQSRASFVVCPCCYGSIQSNHLVQYPRSEKTGLSLKQYTILAHASDQTHDHLNKKTEQGYFCMKVIDNDRLVYMQQNQYQTWLTKIIPENASPKNHILVGVHSISQSDATLP